MIEPLKSREEIIRECIDDIHVLFSEYTVGKHTDRAMHRRISKRMRKADTLLKEKKHPQEQ